MATITFDTLTHAKKLHQAGLDLPVAEVFTQSLAEIVEKLATKEDVAALETALQKDMNHLEDRLNKKITDMGYQLTIRLGGLVLTGVTALAILMKAL